MLDICGDQKSNDYSFLLVDRKNGSYFRIGMEDNRRDNLPQINIASGNREVDGCDLEYHSSRNINVFVPSTDDIYHEFEKLYLVVKNKKVYSNDERNHLSNNISLVKVEDGFNIVFVKNTIIDDNECKITIRNQRSGFGYSKKELATYDEYLAFMLFLSSIYKYENCRFRKAIKIVEEQKEKRLIKMY